MTMKKLVLALFLLVSFATQAQSGDIDWSDFQTKIKKGHKIEFGWRMWYALLAADGPLAYNYYRPLPPKASMKDMRKLKKIFQTGENPHTSNNIKKFLERLSFERSPDKKNWVVYHYSTHQQQPGALIPNWLISDLLR
jgi:hypothetical protein